LLGYAATSKVWLFFLSLTTDTLESSMRFCGVPTLRDMVSLLPFCRAFVSCLSRDALPAVLFSSDADFY
jgi:hypothetical protein